MKGFTEYSHTYDTILVLTLHHFFCLRSASHCFSILSRARRAAVPSTCPAGSAVGCIYYLYECLQRTLTSPAPHAFVSTVGVLVD